MAREGQIKKLGQKLFGSEEIICSNESNMEVKGRRSERKEWTRISGTAEMNTASVQKAKQNKNKITTKTKIKKKHGSMVY